MNILITGSSGFLGSHILPILKKKFKKSKFFCPRKKKYDLTKYKNWEKLFKYFKPDYLVHLAALSGGIEINSIKPANFFFINSLLVANAFENAAKSKVKKIIFPFGGCSYPATSSSPIEEKKLWEGYPQINSEGYSVAKKTGVTAAYSYKKQYNIDTLLIIPGNMYGEFDNFRKEESHVIPALIRRFYEAKIRNKKYVEIWGSGSAKRDFVYVGDVAKTIVNLMGNLKAYNSPINISSGKKISILQLAKIIQKKIDFKGEIVWNLNKPEGQKVKIYSIKKLKSLKKNLNFTSLDEGLNKTISWFVDNYSKKNKNLRI